MLTTSGSLTTRVLQLKIHFNFLGNSVHPSNPNAQKVVLDLIPPSLFVGYYKITSFKSFKYNVTTFTIIRWSDRHQIIWTNGSDAT